MECESVSTSEASIGSEITTLLKRIGKGDRPALITLYDHTSRLLFGIALRILRDEPIAEEVLLDTYTQIWKQAGSYDPEFYTPLEWLTMLARDVAIIRLHLTKKDRRRSRSAAAGTDSPITVAIEQQRNARFLMASLAPIQREILEWAYYSGLSCSEIAAQIGKPLGAVKTHARLALSKLENSLYPSSGQEKKTILE